MSRRLVALLGATCLLLLGLGSAIAMGHGDGDHPKSHHQKGNHHPGGKKGNVALFAELNGRNEISTTTGQRGAGDPDGFGSASFTLDGDQLCFGITVANLDTPTAAHIHRGRKTENGVVVIPLTPQPTPGDPGASSGCVMLDTAALTAVAAEIQANPRGFYANVHTTAFPAGAVRGQLKALGGHHHHHH
jgi:hypothetical protein